MTLRAHSSPSASDWLEMIRTGWGSTGCCHPSSAIIISIYIQDMFGESCALAALDNIAGCIYKIPHILVIYMKFYCSVILISHKQSECLWKSMVSFFKPMIKHKIWAKTQMVASIQVFNFPPNRLWATYKRGIQTCQITILINIIIITLITWNVVLFIHILFWTFFCLFNETCQIKK